MSKPILTIEDLHVSQLNEDGEKRVVKGVSLAIHPGEIVGVVGESGSGKSTLVKSILRICGPPAVIRGGRATFDGHDLLAQDPAVIKQLRWTQLSIVMQSSLNALNPVLTIHEQMTDALIAQHQMDPGDASTVAERCIGMVELDAAVLRAYPHELSGGMKQRVALAMALAPQPNLIVMDEPTTALDAIVEKEILRRLLELQAEMKFAVVFITHDIELLCTFADRIVVMEDGVLIDQGTPQALRANPNHPTTRELMTAMPRVDGPRPDDLPLLPAVDGEPIITAKDLRMVFGSGLFGGDSTVAVDGVSFSLRPGETVALVGESGSGKSTIGRIVGGLQRPTAGTVVFDGHRVTTRMKPARRRQLQFVFQDPFASLNPTRRVGVELERLVMRRGGTSGSGARAEVERLMTLVELDSGLLDRFPHGLSGGQRQRIAIARALATRPKAIIADEPTSMLDVSVRMGVLQVLQRLQRELGIAILLITHDLAAARFFSHRILVLKDGKVVETDDAERLVMNPTHPYSVDLLQAAGTQWLAKERPA